MSLRQSVVIEAREWVGTPFRHQCRLKHIACDCIGLIWGVGERVGVLQTTLGAVAPYKNYGRQPNPNHMREGLRLFLRPTLSPKEGDIVWLEWRNSLPMHVGILATFEGRKTIIHSFRDTGCCVEHGFTDEWRARVDSYWSYIGLEGVV